VFPFGGLVTLRFRETCHQVTRVLSCGSSERRRQPGVVGPYWLSPTSSPLAQFFKFALGPEVFRHLTRTRGCKHKRVLPPVFFDATAEYYRSDESSVPVCRSCFGRCMRGAEHRTIQGAATHPAIGASPAGGTRRSRARNSRASPRGDARGGRIAQRLSLALRSRPRPRADVFPPCGGGRSSEQRRAASPRRQAGEGTRAPVGVTTCVATRDRSPFEAFCSGLPTGVPGRKRRATGQVTVRRGDPKVASRGVPTEVGPEAQDTQREHDDASHGVRFLSAR
jgi:hypothetical protein